MKKVDYLIIGQGFAGTFFAFDLLQNNKSFVIIDSMQLNASKVAAGIYNPVVLKRFAPIWNAEKQIDYFEKRIKEIELFLGVTLLNTQPVVRIFHNTEEQQIWLDKSKKEKVSLFLNTSFTDNYLNIKSPYKTATVNKSGRINAKLFIDTFRQYFLQNNSLLNSTFNFKDLKTEENKFIYKNITANKIIFAEGKNVLQNPFFNYLPIQLNKGEGLHIKISKPIDDFIFKKKSFLVQQKLDSYYVGSTYSLQDTSLTPTQQNKTQLIAETQEIYTAAFTVENHFIGFRPVTKDRRPMVGKHPIVNNMYILNGMGTRGTLLGNYFSNKLYKLIEHNIPLEKQADIARYKELFLV